MSESSGEQSPKSILKFSTANDPSAESHAGRVDRDTRRLEERVQSVVAESAADEQDAEQLKKVLADAEAKAEIAIADAEAATRRIDEESARDLKKFENEMEMVGAITEIVGPYEDALKAQATKQLEQVGSKKLHRRFFSPDEFTIEDFSLSPNGEEEYPMKFEYQKNKDRKWRLVRFSQGLSTGQKDLSIGGKLVIDFSDGHIDTVALAWSHWDLAKRSDDSNAPDISGLRKGSSLDTLIGSESFIPKDPAPQARSPHSRYSWDRNLSYDVSQKEIPTLTYRERGTILGESSYGPINNIDKYIFDPQPRSNIFRHEHVIKPNMPVETYLATLHDVMALLPVA
jgi:hypothetical protein